jgi:hypothetical protein
LPERNTLNGKGYGFFPEHEFQSILFEECAMDLIGPWKPQVCGKPQKLEAIDVPIQEPKSRSQIKIPSQKHKSYLLFVCLLACLKNSSMGNDS